MLTKVLRHIFELVVISLKKDIIQSGSGGGELYAGEAKDSQQILKRSQKDPKRSEKVRKKFRKMTGKVLEKHYLLLFFYFYGL